MNNVIIIACLGEGSSYFWSSPPPVGRHREIKASNQIAPCPKLNSAILAELSAENSI